MSSNSQSPGGEAPGRREAQEPPRSSPPAALASSPARSHNDNAIVGSPPADGARGSPSAVDDVRSSPHRRGFSNPPSAGDGDDGGSDEVDATGSPARSLPPTPMTDFSPPRSFSGSIPRTPSSMGRSLPGTPRTPFTPMDMQVRLQSSRVVLLLLLSWLARGWKGRFCFLLLCVLAPSNVALFRCWCMQDARASVAWLVDATVALCAL